MNGCKAGILMHRSQSSS